jgi:dTMP kinase
MTDVRGVFITFEGVDGSGKSTQMRILAERLRAAGHEVVETVEPGGTRVGCAIRDILLDPEHQELCATAELLLYFAARAQNVDQVIEPALAAGKIVLSDRFTDSTLAYQGSGRGLGADVVLKLDAIACRGLKPDLTICLDFDVEAGIERARERGLDRMDAQALDFHARVRQAYRDLAAHESRVRLIDAAGTPQEVSARVNLPVAALVSARMLR